MDGNVCLRMAGVVAAIALGVFALAAAPSAHAQVPERGHQLAERWCSSCHGVDRDQISRTTAPSFADIATRRQGDQKWVRAWLMAPHPSMPDLSLTRREIDDVVAYLQSLAPRKTN